MNKQRYSILLLFCFLFQLAAKAQPRQGQLAAEVALPSVSGDTIRLSSLKGKVVLLDFWASWCGPCRVSNKNLVKLYAKYKASGFEILGVSLDDEATKWKTAIRQDKITWLQVNDAGGWDARIAQAWGINAIPTSYLIDKDGKLLAMDLEGKELEKALKYLLDK
ncbi:MAG: TlpA family protein disulfide reductase [Chitinophagaceae bacterium]|nr:TlpA family protein disulfide reductase [Chitinophagaceae bacterium]